MRRSRVRSPSAPPLPPGSEIFVPVAQRIEHSPPKRGVAGSIPAGDAILPLGACLSDARLLRPPQLGIFLRSSRLHSPRYARETIAESCSIWVALATAIMTQAGS